MTPSDFELCREPEFAVSYAMHRVRLRTPDPLCEVKRPEAGGGWRVQLARHIPRSRYAYGRNERSSKARASCIHIYRDRGARRTNAPHLRTRGGREFFRYRCYDRVLPALAPSVRSTGKIGVASPLPRRMCSSYPPPISVIAMPPLLLSLRSFYEFFSFFLLQSLWRSDILVVRVCQCSHQTNHPQPHSPIYSSSSSPLKLRRRKWASRGAFASASSPAPSLRSAGRQGKEDRIKSSHAGFTENVST